MPQLIQINGTDSIAFVQGGQVQFFGNADRAAGLAVSIAREDGKITVSWADPTDTAVLQSADAIAGFWEDVPGAFSPHTVTSSADRKFYRLRK